MKNKTCGECRHFSCSDEGRCMDNEWTFCDSDACDKFQPKVITNGDVIRQGGNDALIDFADGIRRRMCHYCAFSKDKSCVDKTGDCWEGVRAWLNAQAEINTESEEQ